MSSDTPMLKIEMEALEKTYFGTYMNQGRQGRKPFEFYHFVLTDDWIIAIAKVDPVIKVYDTNSLKLSHDIHYDTVPVVKGTVDYIADERLHNPSPNTTYTLVQDVSQYQNHLYLLVIGKEGGTSCNHVVEFKIDGNNIQYERVLVLDDGAEKCWYSAFLVDNDCFLAYSAISGCIHRFTKP